MQAASAACPLFACDAGNLQLDEAAGPTASRAQTSPGEVVVLGRAERPRLVVGVGASAGGLEAFKKLLKALPADKNMAFLLVQHLDPNHESLLSELLTPCTPMKVQDAKQGVPIEANTVYIIRPDTSLGVRRGRIEVSEPTLHRGVRLPVDHLFRSLAREYGPRAAAIVLSGAGSDGSSGVRDVKAAGGLSIAQDPETSGQTGMPTSAADTGAIDLVLDISEMPTALERFSSLPAAARADGAEKQEEPGDAPRLQSLNERQVGRLAVILEAQASFDLRVYKLSTVERRVLRRMTLAGFDALDPYLQHLRNDSQERQAIIRDLLISVTDFFRDREAFEALREAVVEPLVSQAGAGETLRIWVAACATGEEAYSLGMEFLEATARQNKRLPVQIFATDIDQDALSFARAGIYPMAIAEHIPQKRLEKHFELLEGHGYQVGTALRDIVSFAAHDLTKDPPFSRMHLVSCRNALIYLTTDAQKEVLKALHFALEPQGHLFLSTSESTGAQRDLFTTISKTHRIYKKLGRSRPLALSSARNRGYLDMQTPDEGKSKAKSTDRREVGEADPARRAVVEALAPPTLVVDQDGSILFSHGELDPFVRMPQGDHPQFELSSVIRPELATRTRGALYKCRRSGEAVTTASSPDGSSAQVIIQARPAPSLGDETVILTFEKAQIAASAEPPQPESPEQEAVIQQLEKELQATREDLRNTVEELETSNEELRSSNEESMSMNEELQSANEELEATTEELRSLNEELTTVNAQLRDKVEQLEHAHDDLANFFASTKIATVFLDDQLCIKRFTPAARDLLDIDHADIGRRVESIARQLLQSDLVSETRRVLDHLSGVSREIQTDDGRWVAREVLPYRTESRRIEGVVITFTEITELKNATQRLALRERQQGVVAKLGLRALQETDLSSFFELVVREVQQTLDTDFCGILELQPGEKRLLLRAGVGWQPGQVGTASVEVGSESQAGCTLQSAEPVLVDDLATEKRFKGCSLLAQHDVKSGASCVIGGRQHAFGVLGVHTRSRREFRVEDANFLQAVAAVINSAVSRQLNRLHLALELETTRILPEAFDVEEGLELVLQALLRKLSAEVGEIWWLPSEGGVPVRRTLSAMFDKDRKHIEKRLPDVDGGGREPLVSEVAERRRARWYTEFGEPKLSEMHAGAKHLKLISGFGVPICSGNEILGVTTLLSSNPLFADQVFLDGLNHLGRTIGDFVGRIASEERARSLAAITESSHDAIFSYALDGTVTKWLPGAEHLYGYSTEEMLGQSIERIVPESEREAFWSSSRRICRGELDDPVEAQRRRQDGTTITVSMRSSPVRDLRGEVQGVSSTERDVTSQKEAELKLVEADRQKDEFLAMLGHELRNPLSAIRSAAEVLQAVGHDDARIQRVQAILERQSSHMAKLLDGLLDVSRIIRGKVQLESELVEWTGVIRDLVSDVTESLRRESVQFETDIANDEIWISGDPVRLAQIADNLLSNAMKYTEDGGKITLRLEKQDATAVLTVTDTGVGIEAELLPHVFEIFRQSKQSIDRSEGGLGVGLALTKSLVEMHGGEVLARSEGKGRGSEFEVRLPVASKLPPRSERVAKAKGESLNLLIIEDNLDSAELLQHSLQLMGHNVVFTSRGSEGVSLAKEGTFDAVLSDIGLPGEYSGYDVAKALRASESTKDAVLIALTGYGRPEDKDRSRRAGFDAHVTKPVDTKEVSRILDQFLNRSS